MKINSFFICFLFFNGCDSSSIPAKKNLQQSIQIKQKIISSKKFDEKSWQYFLQHLPLIDGPILDYQGNSVSYQQKHVAIVNYDVGKSDLQQCADALMRLRAEYLYKQQHFSEIGFHFVSGQYYSWNDYCKGLKAEPEGDKVRFVQTSSCSKTHESLRKYLDIFILMQVLSLLQKN